MGTVFILVLPHLSRTAQMFLFPCLQVKWLCCCLIILIWHTSILSQPIVHNQSLNYSYSYSLSLSLSRLLGFWYVNMPLTISSNMKWKTRVIVISLAPQKEHGMTLANIHLIPLKENIRITRHICDVLSSAYSPWWQDKAQLCLQNPWFWAKWPFWWKALAILMKPLFCGWKYLVYDLNLEKLHLSPFSGLCCSVHGNLLRNFVVEWSRRA